jgi:hypothetical protein
MKDVGIFDVGGQRSERRKWLTLFEVPLRLFFHRLRGVRGTKMESFYQDVNALLFLVAASEYDQQVGRFPPVPVMGCSAA